MNTALAGGAVVGQGALSVLAYKSLNHEHNRDVTVENPASLLKPWIAPLVAGVLLGCAQTPTHAPSTPPPVAVAHAPSSRLDGAGISELARRVDRLTWGASPSSVREAQSMGYAAYLRAQLHPQGPSLPPAIQAMVDSMTISRTPMVALVETTESQRRDADALADAEQKQAARQAYQQNLRTYARESASRELLRDVYSRHQVLEEMSWFWLNHFSIHQFKANEGVLLPDYEEHAIRAHALGRFRDLLGAVAHHPAMLRYLDNEQNAAGHVNENYARELMELHTLGVDAGYTQQDVQELARVLTGVGFAPRNGTFEFFPRRHDFGAKSLLGQPIRSRGLQELDEALDRLAAHPATARFISRKLATYWISDSPPQRVVDELTRTWQQTGGDIARVLETLFETPEFATAQKFKDPMRYVVSAVRFAYDDRPIRNPQPLLNWLNRLAEAPYGRQTPDGYPLESRAWDSSGQMSARFDIARTIGSSGAGLFRGETDNADAPGFPQLTNELYYAWKAGTLGPATQQALAQARTPQEWNTLLLSAPEFMNR